MKKIFLFALIIRLIGIFVFSNIDNYDLRSYFQVGGMTLRSQNIYPEVAGPHHPYFPFFLYLESLVVFFGQSKFASVILMKLIINLFDLGNVYLVYLLSKKNLKKALIYSVNPVSFLISTLHGQFDSIPLFFLLAGIYFIKSSLGTLVLSLAVMVKTWPILFIIPFFKKLTDKKTILLIFVFPILSIFIYSFIFSSNVIEIIKTVIGYQSLWGIWGLSLFFSEIRIRWQKLFIGLFLLLFFYLSSKVKSNNLVKLLFFLLYFFLVFTPSFSIQYFSWFMPFLIIVKPKNFWKILFAISGYLLFSYLSWIYPFITPEKLSSLGSILWFYLASDFLMVYRKKNLIKTA